MAVLQFSAASIAGIAAGLSVFFVYAAALVVYNLAFHPLRRFPGPLLHRATKLGYICRLMRGSLAQDVHQMHLRYGPVVRVAPNQLAFVDAVAWKDIYCRRTPGSIASAGRADASTNSSSSSNPDGVDELAKDPVFYFSSPGAEPSLIAESRENHPILRRLMAHGFSDRAMREQEPIIASYVDLLIRRLHESCSTTAAAATATEKTAAASPTASPPATPTPTATPTTTTGQPQALDMRAWYNWTTFDIIGDLAFGEPFGCLDRAAYDPWVEAVNNTVYTGGVMMSASMLGIVPAVSSLIEKMRPARSAALRMAGFKVKRRMDLGVERPDFMESLLKKKDELNINFKKLCSNASLLVLAGSETTATLLCGATYLLLRNPAALARVVAEVRSTFASDKDITLLSVSDLPYMLACLDESLRCYPPLPTGMLRVTPPSGIDIAGHFIPGGTSVACWQWAINRSPLHWKDPDTFRPERFLDAAAAADAPADAANPVHRDCIEAMQPFSIGPRNCLGRSLAYAEMRLILARILFNFDLELANPDENWMDQKAYLLWSKPRLMVKLKPVVR